MSTKRTPTLTFKAIDIDTSTSGSSNPGPYPKTNPTEGDDGRLLPYIEENANKAPRDAKFGEEWTIPMDLILKPLSDMSNCNQTGAGCGSSKG